MGEPERLAGACPRCVDCQGIEHHWVEANDRRSSRYVCKHCEAQCYAVDDEDDPMGGYKPSGVVIVVTHEMRAARDQVAALIESLGDDMPGLTSARWLFEEVGDLVDATLDAIEDGEIEDDDCEPPGAVWRLDGDEDEDEDDPDVEEQAR